MSADGYRMRISSNYLAAMKYLEAALDADNPVITTYDLIDELNAPGSKAKLWAGDKSAVFTRIVDYEGTGARVCEVAPAGGDLDEILDRARPEIEAWAKAQGCSQIHIQAGRSGWKRALAPFGYEEAAVLLRKIL